MMVIAVAAAAAAAAAAEVHRKGRGGVCGANSGTGDDVKVLGRSLTGRSVISLSAYLTLS